MMFMLHFLEFLLFSVVQTGSYLKASKKKMNWFESFNYCKLSTLENVQKLNVTNVWVGGLYLETPWMFHRGCFNNIGTWDIPAQPYSPSQYEGNITSACSYECRKIKLFALKANRCACLNSLRNMVVTKMDNCKMICNGSERDPCGDARYYTVYEQKDFENFQKAENGTTYNRRSEFKWIINKTFTEISNETADFHNVKCLLLNESLQYVPMSCSLNYSALCESGSEKEQRTKTADINHVNTSPFSNRLSVISEAFTTTSSSGTKLLVPDKITSITVITVVGALITVGMAIVILLLYRRNRKRIIHHSRNSASNDIHASLEGEQTMQMFSSNDRSRNRTNTVPFILQHKQHPGNISVNKYQDPIDMENQYQRLDFSMQSDLKEVHDDYSLQFYKQTSTPAVNDDGSKPLTKAGLTKGTIDLKEVYNNYSLPYDALSRPPEVKKDDMKIQIKVRLSVTTRDENTTTSHTAILQ